MSISSVSSNTPAADNTNTNSQLPTSPMGKDVFLQLLVSQIKNQDPLNPMDSMNFVTQLAQFSELEATLSIRDDMKSLVAVATQE